MGLSCIFLLSTFVLFIKSDKLSLNLDAYFNATDFPFISVSSTGKHLIYQTTRSKWEADSDENILWMYDITSKRKQMITNRLLRNFRPMWSPSGERFIFSQITNTTSEETIHIYSISMNRSATINVGRQRILAITWSNEESILYFATSQTNTNEEEITKDKLYWHDVIRHRSPKISDQSVINRLDLIFDDRITLARIQPIRFVPYQINSLVYVPWDQQIFFTSIKFPEEDLQNFEIYSFHISESSSIQQHTHNTLPELSMELSRDGQHILFLLAGDIDQQDYTNMSQPHLYSLDVSTGVIQRMARDFQGTVMSFSTNFDGSIYMLGLLGTEIQLYYQKTFDQPLISHHGWNGTYDLFSSCGRNGIFVFVHSSLTKPKEIYLIDNIELFREAKSITTDNEYLRNYDFPEGRVYRWKNHDDERSIEGLLHYPPGKLNEKKLPLLVLIHGGPNSASVQAFRARWYAWAALAASEGWLVLEPNYRGSTGYGDYFVDELRLSPLTRPGKDILYGVDQLIDEGIVDQDRMTIAGYSYGGYLTNWLITQTTRFKAACSGAGAVEHVSSWGTFDIPTYIQYLFGGYPWQSRELYQNQSAIYYISNVRTATLILTGEADVRVVPDQSYMFERALSYIDVPVQLLIFPGEGHGLSRNPWHGKIKVREELKWLKKYGV